VTLPLESASYATVIDTSLLTLGEAKSVPPNGDHGNLQSLDLMGIKLSSI
jgi:hypothetical protein